MIVKQLIATGLSFLYMIALMGVPVNVHFCKGDIVSIGIIPSVEDCCCHEVSGIRECCNHELPEKTCSLENTGECCSNEHYSIQYLEDKQITINTATNSPPGKDHVLNPSVHGSESEDDDSAENRRFYDLPPPNPQPLWLLHCTLTFYG